LGGAVLFVLWIQVATANALPCALSCLLEKSVEQHHHEGFSENHAIGHHMSGAKISAPENCGTPQLLVAAFVAPDFPTPPSIEVAVVQLVQAAPAQLLSAVPEFATPPPRA
jgi:hypothetical protein